MGQEEDVRSAMIGCKTSSNQEFGAGTSVRVVGRVTGGGSKGYKTALIDSRGRIALELHVYGVVVIP